LNYLLPTQTLLDLCAEGSNPALEWAKSVDTRSLRVSVISIADAQAAIMQVENAQERTRLDADFAALIEKMESDAGPPLPFQIGHANIWKALINDPALKRLGQVDRQVYATAMHEGLTVVEEPRPHTPALRELGVNILALGSS
jgi:predicted nucleic acid-binding protein